MPVVILYFLLFACFAAISFVMALMLTLFISEKKGGIK